MTNHKIYSLIRELIPYKLRNGAELTLAGMHHTSKSSRLLWWPQDIQKHAYQIFKLK